MRKGKDFARTALIIALSMSALSGLVVYLLSPDLEVNINEVLMVVGVILVVGFALFLAFRRMRDIKSDLPAEDEFSKKIMRRAGATSYYVSLYLWLALMMFEEIIALERSSLIGAGIMGMALIFALSWIYHRYIRTAHD